MPDQAANTGRNFSGSRFVDSMQLIRDRNADSAALTFTAFILPAAFETLRGASAVAAGLVANIATGYLDMGLVDEYTIMGAGAGADNDTFTFAAAALYPVVSSADVGRGTVLGYFQMPVLVGTFTLCAVTLGADGVTSLGGGTGLVLGDRLADTVALTLGTAAVTLQPAADTGPASLRMANVKGPVGMVFKTKLGGTTTQAYLYGVRQQGTAQRKQ